MGTGPDRDRSIMGPDRDRSIMGPNSDWAAESIEPDPGHGGRSLLRQGNSIFNRKERIEQRDQTGNSDLATEHTEAQENSENPCISSAPVSTISLFGRRPSRYLLLVSISPTVPNGAQELLYKPGPVGLRGRS